jgi:hypothetical protein
MSKILKRPMFRRGGYADTGIMDGFNDGGRVHASSGLSVNDLSRFVGTDEDESPITVQDLDLSLPERKNTSPVFREREFEEDPAFGLQDYISLFKLGAGIAGAPGRGDGLGGLLDSASEPLQQFADEFGASTAAKAARKREFEDTEAARRDAFEAEQRGYTRENTLLDKEYKLKTALEETKADLDIADITLRLEQAKPLKAELADLITQKDTIMATGTPSEKRDILTRIRSKQNEIAGVMGQAIDVGDIDETRSRAIKDDAKNNALNDLGLTTPPKPGDPNYQEYTSLRRDYEQYFTVEYLLLVTEGAEFAEGGRVGLANGGGPFEPGSGPDPDPGSPPIMQGESPMLSFEELRARLPKEVTDQVIRLLATSEGALLDFANIDTQEDIAIFNQKYNVDLQLPAQVA